MTKAYNQSSYGLSITADHRSNPALIIAAVAIMGGTDGQPVSKRDTLKRALITAKQKRDGYYLAIETEMVPEKR